MAEYPSRKEIRDGLADGELAELVENMPSYHRSPRVVVELNPAEVTLTADLMHAWAYLAEALQEHVPTATLDGWKLSRPLTAEELDEAAIAWKCNTVYQERQEAEKTAANAEPLTPPRDVKPA